MYEYNYGHHTQQCGGHIDFTRLPLSLLRISTLVQYFNVWTVLIKRPKWIDFIFADYVDITQI
jgi:hypothetical protein